jgi:hypothetical protein
MKIAMKATQVFLFEHLCALIDSGSLRALFVPRMDIGWYRFLVCTLCLLRLFSLFACECVDKIELAQNLNLARQAASKKRSYFAQHAFVYRRKRRMQTRHSRAPPYSPSLTCGPTIYPGCNFTLISIGEGDGWSMCFVSGTEASRCQKAAIRVDWPATFIFLFLFH